MATNDARPEGRVVYVGPGRRGPRIFPLRGDEDHKMWRERQAAEMEEVCRNMLQQGLRLRQIVPVTMTNSFAGGSTDGAWLYFANNQAG